MRLKLLQFTYGFSGLDQRKLRGHPGRYVGESFKRREDPIR